MFQLKFNAFGGLRYKVAGPKEGLCSRSLTVIHREHPFFSDRKGWLLSDTFVLVNLLEVQYSPAAEHVMCTELSLIVSSFWGAPADLELTWPAILRHRTFHPHVISREKFRACPLSERVVRRCG